MGYVSGLIAVATLSKRRPGRVCTGQMASYPNYFRPAPSLMCFH